MNQPTEIDMTVTKDQRAHRRAVIRRALREHFTGAGVGTRRTAFLQDLLLSFGGCTVKLLCMASWAVVAGLLAGPRHEVFLRDFHAWMLSHPVEQFLVESHSMFLWVLAWCTATGLVVGLTRAVARITDPALEEAELALVSPGA
jgi:hypothetical protein